MVKSLKEYSIDTRKMVSLSAYSIYMPITLLFNKSYFRTPLDHFNIYVIDRDFRKVLEIMKYTCSNIDLRRRSYSVYLSLSNFNKPSRRSINLWKN